MTVSGDIAGVTTLPQQIEFAALRTTNDLLTQAQTEIVRGLKRGLHIRGNWTDPRTKFGVNVVFAKKGTLEGSVGTAADWLLEEEGYHDGVKTASGQPNKSGYTPKGLAIPDIGNARPSLLAKMPAGQKAGKLLANAQRTKAFKITSAKTGKELILQRVGLDASGTALRGSRGQLRIGRKSERVGGTDVVLKAVIEASVRVPQKKIFVKEGTQAMNVINYAAKLGINLLNALRTAKTK